jgi:acyl-coenzyme A synthetase/AMP-(fatty) acid ligase
MELSPSGHLDTFCRDHLPPFEQWPELRFDLPELRYPDRLNCAFELLDEVVKRNGPDWPAVISAELIWTYGELLQTANQVAQVLVEDLGLVPGNRVLLRGPNNPWLVACWFGVLKAGGVVVTTMPLLRAGELRTIGEMAQVGFALCDLRFVDDLAKSGLDSMRTLTYGGGAGELESLCASKDGNLVGASVHEPTPSGKYKITPIETAADDVSLLAFTSGTTGRPKATMHFHRDVLAIADTFSKHVLRPTESDVFCGTPPLAFTYGLGGLVVFPFRVGASVLLLEKATPEELFRQVAEHQVSVLFTAPTAYRAVLPLLDEIDVTSLRRCVSAGEALPKATWEAFHEATGIKIIDGIGATEMLHIFIAAADDDIRPGSTGKPVPGYQARVVGPDGAPVADGEIGRLAVKGPTGCRYLADDRQRDYVKDGWNLTGDAYLRDADGYYWFQARADDMIISSGYNIAGPEVEGALLKHPDVLECGVVGVPDEARGAIVKAYVVLREGAPATDETAAALVEFCKQEIAPYKHPRAVEFVSELPRTNTGKLQRFRLRERH